MKTMTIFRKFKLFIPKKCKILNYKKLKQLSTINQNILTHPQEIFSKIDKEIKEVKEK